jgi:hypothetical protein
MSVFALFLKKLQYVNDVVFNGFLTDGLLTKLFLAKNMFNYLIDYSAITFSLFNNSGCDADNFTYGDFPEEGKQ